MKIISWDIGINNLAYCILENTKILHWDKIDILEDIRQKENICQGLLKNGNACSKKSSFYKINDEDLREYYCGTHGKGLNKILSHEICQCLNKSQNTCKLKAQYYELLDNNEKKYYCNKHFYQCQNKDNIKKYITLENITFYQRSKFLFDKLIKLGPMILDIDEVVIENQPVHKNPIMKSIQMMLYSFYMLNNSDQRFNEIYLLNATQKMTVYKGPKIECNIKDKHERNKYLAKEYCKYLLQNENENENKENIGMLEYFNSYDKKDDLADTYLQGLYFMNTHYKS